MLHKTKQIFLLLTCASSLYSMRDSFRVLTQEEIDCITWFETAKSTIGWGFKNLSEEDQQLFKTTSYCDAKESLARVMNHFAQGFYQKMQTSNMTLQFNVDILSSALIKIKEYVAARMYVFSQLLTPEERDSILREQYLENPHAAYDAMCKCGRLLAQEFARVGLIEDTEVAKNRMAQEFLDNKMEELDRAFNK